MSSTKKDITKAKLEYFITDQPPVLMVSFFGVIADETAAEIRKCQDEIISRAHDPVVVLSLQGSVSVKNDGIPLFAELQKAIRDAKKQLYLCSVGAGLKKLLLARRAARKEEIVDSLMDVMRILATPRSE